MIQGVPTEPPPRWTALLDEVTANARALPGLTTLLLHGSSARPSTTRRSRYQDVDLLFVFRDEDLVSGIRAVDELFERLDALSGPDDLQIYRRHSGPMHPVRDPRSGEIVDLRRVRIVFWHVSIFPASAFSTDVARPHPGGPSRLLLYTWRRARVLAGDPLPIVGALTAADLLEEGLGIRDSLDMLKSRSRGYWEWDSVNDEMRLSWRIVPWEDFEVIEFPLYAVRWAMRHVAAVVRRRLPYTSRGVEALVCARDPEHASRLRSFTAAEEQRDAWREAFTADPAAFCENVDVERLVSSSIVLLEDIAAVLESFQGPNADVATDRRWALPLGDHESRQIVMTGTPAAILKGVTERIAPDKILVLVDATFAGLFDVETLIAPLRNASLPVTTIAQRPGAEGKSLTDLVQVLERAEGLGLTRSSMVLLIGGGNVGNMGGVVAGLVCRGVSYVHVPTTVTAALDSAIGQKQSINGALAKNYFGLLHAPEAVIVDPALLLTLPNREVRNGLVEALKHGLCQDAELVSSVHRLVQERVPLAVLADVVARTIELKLEYLNEDPTEMGDGQFLELGHKIGHAVEHLEHGALGHGECIAFGMLAEAKLADLRGIGSTDTTAVIKDAIRPFVDGFRDLQATPGAIADQVSRDNRRHGSNVTFACLDGPQRPRTVTWNVHEIHGDLAAATAWARSEVQDGPVS